MGVFIVLGSFLVLGYQGVFSSDVPLVNKTELAPPLDISRFASYTLEASIDRFPQSKTATAEIYGINGDGGNYWNYKTDGTPMPDTVTRNLTFDSGSGKWKSSSVYPDNLYPEIYYAPSSITWYNQPQNEIVRRNNYQILHFQNSYTPTGDMSFWVEFNAFRQSTVNSANLQVYLVGSGNDISFFQKDWRADPEVELVGAITKDAEPNHVHTANASHHLVALATNPDGTVGLNNINISGDFWVVLYSTSPNDARGYNLRYQPSNLCNNNSTWYSGSQSGWTTTVKSGCPDSHVHMTRRSSIGGIKDGVRIVTTAVSDGETGTKTNNYYYNELPNMAPNATVFRNPVLGGSYSGNLNVTWDPAGDPNNDPLTYTIKLYDQNLSQVGDPLITNTSDTSFSLDTTKYPDGNYYLKGTVCDQAPLCAEFEMPRKFTINNSSVIQSITSISISSNNSTTGYVKEGETVTLNFTTSGAISNPTVGFYSSGHVPKNPITTTSSDNIHWTSSFVVSDQAPYGEISFEIHAANLDKDYYETTDGTKLIVDIFAPEISILVPANGVDAVAVDSNLNLTLSENIIAIAGKNIYIKKTSDNSVIETISANDPKVTVSNAEITINPATAFTNKTGYYVLIDAGAFRDMAGNLFADISSSTTWNFTVGDVTPPTLSSVHIASDNSNTSIAIPGNTVTLSFTSNETISTPTVTMQSGSSNVSGAPVVANTSGNTWTATYTISQSDTDGDLTFIINFSDENENSGTEVSTTTDGSSIIVGTSKPGTPVSIPVAGTYTSTQNVILNSPASSIIRYTTDGTTPSCDIGAEYTGSIAILITTTIKAIGCNAMGNASSISSLEFIISPATPVATPSTTTPTREEESTQTPVQNSTQSTNTNSTSTSATSSPGNIQNPNVAELAAYGTVPQLYNLKIYVAEDDKPLSKVKVELRSEPRIEHTDYMGIAKFTDVEPGPHQVKIFLANRVLEKNMDVEGQDKDYVVNFDLTTKKPVRTYYLYGLIVLVAVSLLCLLIDLKRRQTN